MTPKEQLLWHQRRLLLASVKVCLRRAKRKPQTILHELDAAIVMCRSLVESLR